MSMSYVLGVVVGILVGIVILVILFKLTRKDGSMKCKYDERQELIRGRAYKGSFFTLLIYFGVNVCFGDVFEKFVENEVLAFMGICLGVVVYAAYCIWNEAYFALNENPKKMIVAFLIIAVMNVVGSYPRIIDGSLLENGKLGMGCINLLCAALMLVVVLVLVIKKVHDKTLGMEE